VVASAGKEGCALIEPAWFVLHCCVALDIVHNIAAQQVSLLLPHGLLTIISSWSRCCYYYDGGEQVAPRSVAGSGHVPLAGGERGCGGTRRERYM
jgi:hypothetical protein